MFFGSFRCFYRLDNVREIAHPALALEHEVRDGDFHEVYGLDHAVHGHRADRRIARYKEDAGDDHKKRRCGVHP